ncbi:MAG TPA: MucR family transcriptional regulator [Alphaproteobacteria bacterium]|nr:MucR family transcriptional regulator [Alphaproteobacteria bacterium]
MSNVDGNTVPNNDEMLRLATDIVSAYVQFNPLPAAQLAQMIRDVHDTLASLAGSAPSSAERQKPAIAIKKSITPDYIVCLEDGKKLKMLKRYLRARYDLSPEEYRAKWGLPADYPMVAPKYAEQRSQFAKQIGLGRTATKRRGRRSTRAA